MPKFTEKFPESLRMSQVSFKISIGCTFRVNPLRVNRSSFRLSFECSFAWNIQVLAARKTSCGKKILLFIVAATLTF